jgi:hypothetical protein
LKTPCEDKICDLDKAKDTSATVKDNLEGFEAFL